MSERVTFSLSSDNVYTNRLRPGPKPGLSNTTASGHILAPDFQPDLKSVVLSLRVPQLLEQGTRVNPLIHLIQEENACQ